MLFDVQAAVSECLLLQGHHVKHVPYIVMQDSDTCESCALDILVVSNS